MAFPPNFLVLQFTFTLSGSECALLAFDLGRCNSSTPLRHVAVVLSTLMPHGRVTERR